MDIGVGIIIGKNTKNIKKPKKKAERFPWPRLSEEEPKVQLGIDVVAKRLDIVRIVHKFFRVRGYTMEELLQEVYLAIIHKNQTRSAHNPNKSSFSHYVYMIANNVCINLVNKRKRYEKETDSLDSPISSDDPRSIMEFIDESSEFHNRENDNEFQGTMAELERALRFQGEWDLARYVRAVRSGANLEIIREAMSFGDRKFTNKMNREMKSKLVMITGNGQKNFFDNHAA